ncbi:hypothetical protein QR98_0105560 [Sarcoptes scabiei]|uniref:Uncharacterized protein n=1 Tax=Sarcoptes scabiei TaxID=52283 RepID=A0A132ALX4_SARSC|nr:hypothetical protein QR98_0105560 [Sarcoptes scabiei]
MGKSQSNVTIRFRTLLNASESYRFKPIYASADEQKLNGLIGNKIIGEDFLELTIVFGLIILLITSFLISIFIYWRKKQQNQHRQRKQTNNETSRVKKKADKQEVSERKRSIGNFIEIKSKQQLEKNQAQQLDEEEDNGRSDKIDLTAVRNNSTTNDQSTRLMMITNNINNNNNNGQCSMNKIDVENVALKNGILNDQPNITDFKCLSFIANSKTSQPISCEKNDTNFIGQLLSGDPSATFLFQESSSSSSCFNESSNDLSTAKLFNAVEKMNNEQFNTLDRYDRDERDLGCNKCKCFFIKKSKI